MKSILSFAVFASVLFAFGFSEGQPVIIGVEPASLQDGRTRVVISGSSFGTKSRAAPLLWDNFEAGTVGQRIAPANGWSTGFGFDPDPPTYTNINQRTGSSLSSYHDVSHANPTLMFENGSTWTEVYVSFYLRNHITKMGTHGGSEPENIKVTGIWGNHPPSDPWTPELVIEVPGVSPEDGSEFMFSFGYHIGDVYQDRPHTWISRFRNDVWDRQEWWCRIKDDPGQRFKFWHNSVLQKNFTDPSQFPGGSGPYMGDYGEFNLFFLLHFIREGSAGYSQYDDVYFDTTQARVEIGNAATFTGCSHREIQIPATWSSSTITMTVNQGSFQNGTKAYLYVIDANGNVNAQGYPVTFGEAPISDETPPFVTGQSPAPNAQNVPVNSSIVLHIQDSGDGVDVNSVKVRVNGSSVTPQITGTPADYTVTYTPASPFAYGSTVTVSVDAQDRHSPPNVMNTVTYSFTTQPEGIVTEEWGEGTMSDHTRTMKDTYINIDANNYAPDTTSLNTYTWPAKSVANAILINIEDLPGNATVVSAKLFLYMYDASSETTYNVSAHKIVGVDPVIEAATGFTYDGITPWTPYEGLYNGIPLGQADIAPAEQTLAVGTATGFNEWDVTSMVSEWVANPASNHGLMLNSDPSAAADAYRSFRPSEYVNLDQRPRLVITYVVGQPVLPGPPGKPIHVD